MRRFSRSMIDFGLNPLFAVLLIATFFIVSSFYFLYSIEYASYEYVLIGLWVAFVASEESKIRTLKKLFDRGTFRLIRLGENLLLTLPFVLFLVIQAKVIEVALLLICSSLLSLYGGQSFTQLKIPTPFWKNPFEFIVGFRKTILLWLIFLFVAGKAIHVDNFNLLVATFLVSVLLGFSFLTKVEQLYDVWIFKYNTKQFLQYKIRISILNNFILTLPILIASLIFYPQRIWIILVLELVGAIVILTLILAKYSAYPRVMSLPQAILFIVSLAFPPLLILVIPLFYKKAIRQLKPILK